MFFDLEGSPLEILQAKGLEKIVDGIHAIALNGIFGIGRGEDDEWRCYQLPHKVHTVEVGHVDVAEDGIDYFLLHDFLCFEGTHAFTTKLKERHFPDVGGQLLQCQWLVVDGKYFDHIQ